MDKMPQDLKFGLRLLTKGPAFTIAAVLTMALGVGASCAVFSVVNNVLLKPLPYPNVDKIVIPWRQVATGQNLGYDVFPWGQRHFRMFIEDDTTFQDLGAFMSDSFNLTGSGTPTLLEGLRASAGFFPALGVTPALGRIFTPEEDQPGHEHEVVLSYQLWHDRFGGDPGILGRALDLNGYAYTVVGVMPSGFSFPHADEMPGSFTFPREAQIWVPLAVPAAPPVGPDELAVIGRLKPGVTIRNAQAEMDLFSKRLDDQFPQIKGWFNSRVTPLAEQVVGDTRRPLLLTLGAVIVVLLIACTNVAGLILTRSLTRKREFTLRAALGAGHKRLMAQLLTEGFLLALGGGIIGILLGELGILFVRNFGPANIPRLQEVSLDLRVLAFSLAVTAISGSFYGLMPGIAVTRENLAQSLKEGGPRAGGSTIGTRIRSSLLISQVALALVLAIAAGLLIRTFVRMLHTDTGFNAEHVLTLELSLPSSTYPDPQHIVAFYRKTLPQLQSLPGIQAAGIGETVPMGGTGESAALRIKDHPPADPKARAVSAYTIGSPGYFAALGTPLLQGRDFLESDTADSRLVTIINASMARKFWPGEDALGKQVAIFAPQFPYMTVVGIVADVKHQSLRENPGPEMYVPYTQNPWPSMAIMQVALRTKGDPFLMEDNVRRAIESLDANIPMAKVATLNTLVDNSMVQDRFAMLLFTAFGALSVLLAAIGIYGVISYSTQQRTREIGIYMALGAQRSQILRMVLGQGARLAAIGIAIGLVASFGLTWMMKSFLYGVHSVDPLTFTLTVILLEIIALAASFFPARRAMRVDPLVALRNE